jgi:trans-2,3-dihydro-3-hydroxyanthranilate isomerase
MSGHTFHIVDVFAEEKYAGNQLAVVTDAADLDAVQMQAIAREMNFSETSFVLHDTEGEGGFEVRFFTPAEEVPFAGHPTLGTAWIIHREVLTEPRESVTLKLGVGSIPVSFERSVDYSELLWMQQRAPDFGPRCDAETLAEVLGVSPDAFDTDFPVQQVSTGLPFWIAPLRSLDAVKDCRIQPDAHDRFIERREARAILVFARQTHDDANQINVRMFAPALGVPEDPATGSANGCLAAYLVEHHVLGDAEIAVRVEQGCEIGRPSILRLRAWKREDRFDVFVGGRVVPVARGTLL